MVGQPDIHEASKALGRQLAARRRAAGYNQSQLAPLTGYGRSTVANVESGRQSAPRAFWSRCDEVLGAHGALLIACDEIEAMRRQLREENALAAQAERAARVRSWRDGVAAGPSTEADAADAALRLSADGAPGNEATDAIRRTLDHLTATAGPGDEPGTDDLERRVLDGWSHRGRIHDGPGLTLVAGYAGSGKTEFGRFLSTITGWVLLDKDALTRPLTETLLVSLGGEPDDRHTDLYRQRVRPSEYRCLLAAALDNLDCGLSTVVTAPFLVEISDECWLKRLANHCKARSVSLTVVWMHSDLESMHDYLSFRGAARDTWKLSCWDDYARSIDLDLRPRCAHITVDNSFNSATSLADQARDLAGRVRT